MTQSIPVVGVRAYPTPSQIRTTLLLAYQQAASTYGLRVNVLPGSDAYIRFDNVAGRVSLAIANNQLAENDFNPFKATGAALVILCSFFGVYPRPPSSSASAPGSVTITCTGSVPFPVGFLATGPTGLKYKTTATAPVSNGGAVPMVSVDTGKATNLATGTLTWDSATFGNLLSTAKVASPGFSGGTDGDDPTLGADPSILRNRLLLRLAYPAIGGNWAQVAIWAEDSDASIGQAWVYPSVEGPGSYDTVLTGLGTNGASRILPSAKCDVATAAILANMPGIADLTTTSVVEELLDVTVAFKLPLPQVAGGAGGGWLDSVPWPAEDVRVTSTSIVGGQGELHFAAVAHAAAAGDRIALWDPVGGAFVRYTVAAFPVPTTTACAVTATSFSPDPTGAYVSADAKNLDGYATAFLAAVAMLGPGEKSANPDALPRGRREPPTDQGAPADLSNLQLGALVATLNATGDQPAFPEILGYGYGVTYQTGTTTPQTSPTVPAAAADPPGLLRVKNLAFRAK